MHFSLLEYTFSFFSLYTLCAVLLLDSRFHRVWSLSLFLLWFLTAKLFDQPFSMSSVPLALLALLVFTVCIILSPAQLLLFNTKPIGPKRKALEVYSPRDREIVSVEFVLPVNYLDISYLTLSYRLQYRCRSRSCSESRNNMVISATKQQHRCGHLPGYVAAGLLTKGREYQRSCHNLQS